MARKASKARVLWNSFPISEERETFHVIMEIDSTALRYHCVEHLPIWGFRIAETRELTNEWKTVLNDACGDFGYKNAVHLLLTNGLVVEGDNAVGIDDITQPLVKLLQKEALPGLPDSLLPVGKRVAHQFYEIAAQATGTVQLLEPLHSQDFPTQQAFTDESQRQKLHFPWRISLAVAKMKGHQLVDDRFDLLRPGVEPSEPGRFLGQGSFYAAPGEAAIRAILLRSTNGRASEEVIAGAEILVREQPFDVLCEFSFPDSEPMLHANGGRVKKLLPTESLSVPQELPQIIERAEHAAEVAFLLDGSMAAPDFDRARDFILQIVDDLAKEASPVRLGCVIYGEYKREYINGRLWKPDFEVQVRSFCFPSDFERFVEKARCLNPFDHDYCDALELGLLEISRLDWTACTGHLVLIGNSPPHPSQEQRKQYRLLDAETEEFEGILWKRELKRLREGRDLHTSSVWIEPTDGPRPTMEQRAYAETVWRELGEQCRLSGVGKPSMRRLLKLIRNTRHTVRVLDRPLTLPLLEQLVGVEPG
jgi:hypothetical protein